MPLSFLLDEHLRGPLWQSILRHNLRTGNPLDVVRVGDVAELPLGVDDADILRWAAQADRLLVTEDRHSMATHLQMHLAKGHASPGVLMLRGGQTTRDLLECLMLIAYVGEPAEFANVVTFVP